MNCLKKGLRIYKTPASIGYERERESTWFKGYNEKFFYDTGAIIERSFRNMSIGFIIVTVFRKCYLYKGEMNEFNNIRKY